MGRKSHEFRSVAVCVCCGGWTNNRVGPARRRCAPQRDGNFTYLLDSLSWRRLQYCSLRFGIKSWNG